MMKYFNLKKNIYFYYTMILNDMSEDNENIYMRCDLCNYETNHSGDFNKHLLTLKHKKNVNKIKIGTDNSLLNTPINDITGRRSAMGFIVTYKL